MSLTVAILSILISLIIGSIGSYFIYNSIFAKRHIEEGKRLANLENIEMRDQQVKSGILEHKETEEFKSLLEVEFRKGIEEGEKRTMSKLALAYEPFIDISENFFRKTAEAGYTMQMFFNGLPLGDPMKRVTNHVEKYKDENVKYLVDSVNGTLNNILLMVDPLGIPVKVNENPKIGKKKTG